MLVLLLIVYILFVFGMLDHFAAISFLILLYWNLELFYSTWKGRLELQIYKPFSTTTWDLSTLSQDKSNLDSAGVTLGEHKNLKENWVIASDTEDWDQGTLPYSVENSEKALSQEAVFTITVIIFFGP
ncbi:hypothetical protein ACJX0J_013293 [Zea mays]